MAEFIFKDLAEKAGRGAEFYVASSATSNETVWNRKGSRVYAPARAELAKHGISCEGKRAVQLKKSDYDKYDLFIAMDSNNIRNIGRIFGSDPDGKVHKMMDFTSRKGDVADPWYSGRFDVTFMDISEGIVGLLAYIDENYLHFS
jgi:protein-tyrosine phosphatase